MGLPHKEYSYLMLAEEARFIAATGNLIQAGWQESPI